jgi:alcohol dehydrogenase class IV
MYNFLARIFQKTLRLSAYFIGYREPSLIEGEGVITKIPSILKANRIKKVFIVTDKNIVDLKLIDNLLEALKEKAIEFLIYDETKPNPEVKQVEKAYSKYEDFQAMGMIAVGGGSPMDLAKLVLIRHVKPNKPLSKLKGIIKIRKKLPLLIAVPTTVGTGSEATLAAVVTDEDKKQKYAIMDPNLIPHHAVLDINLVKKLPSSIIATTGMDALTHAIEAYIGQSNTKKTKMYALEAIKMIFEELEKAYNHDEESLKKMQMAAYKAGVAFTRAYVGNVHALSHALSAFYDFPHGLANAIVLPEVLDYYRENIYRKMSEIYDYVFDEKQFSDEEKTARIIRKIREMNEKMSINRGFLSSIKDNDLDQLVEHAYKEANPLYPVPTIFRKSDFKKIYKTLMQN